MYKLFPILVFLCSVLISRDCGLNLVQFDEMNTYISKSKTSNYLIDESVIGVYKNWEKVKGQLIIHKIIFNDIMCAANNTVKIKGIKFYFGNVIPSSEKYYNHNEIVYIYTLFDVIYRIDQVPKQRLFVLNQNSIFTSELSSVDSIKITVPAKDFPFGTIDPRPPRPDYPFWISVGSVSLSLIYAITSYNSYDNTTSSSDAIKFHEKSQDANQILLACTFTCGYLTYKKYFKDRN
jgi:hypothetical protein